MSPIRHSATGLLLAAALVACVEAPPRPDEDAGLVARSLMTEGRFLDAAAEYRRLAERAQGDAVWHFSLNAARALIAGSRPDEALVGLESGDWGDATAAQRRQRAILRAELVLARGEAEQALVLLADSLIAGAPPSTARNIRRMRAEALLSSDRPLEAAGEGVALEGLGLSADAARDNRRFIWEALARVTSAGLDAARRPPPSRLGGWIEVVLLHRASRFDHARFEKALEGWAVRFPGHSAGIELVPELLADSLALSQPPAKVALLLPSRGRFAGAARAVRDGFLAAWYRHGDPDTRPAIIVRDTSDADLAALVASVAEEGAEFIVGPLRKSSVREAAGLGRHAVPMLALNRLAGDAATPPAKDFYQFALSPEEEAQEVAARAWRDGYARAAVLVPEGEWGKRVAGAFSSAWAQRGGRIVETHAYATGSEAASQPPDMSAPIEILLNLDESRERRNDLAKALGRRMHFEARPRGDVDTVFMAGFPRELRQLRPQFEFHKAGSMPIYSTSHVYAGVPDPEADSDVDDIVFGDMPMLLPGARDADAARRQLSALWPEGLRAYPRLYAFGLDAFALVTRLRYLEAAPDHVHDGHTGVLRLDEKGRIHRRLTWARFEGGLPRPLDPRAEAP